MPYVEQESSAKRHVNEVRLDVLMISDEIGFVETTVITSIAQPSKLEGNNFSITVSRASCATSNDWHYRVSTYQLVTE